ncbi:hypothetical protein [Massilia sp. YIM B04103]|uniref:hypothetical protein n=1 Tax=Massilia sp. YIM B04103 TaxID=2963106 RepID=UPI00210DEB27|nr:hypothetical protein [Massilia sp. YIM B04103]
MGAPAKSGRKTVRDRPASTQASAAELKAVAEQELERQKRLQAIDLIFGMWKGRTDIAQDGLAFQEELRAEW